jgi:plasmid stabilization system protein ParE
MPQVIWNQAALSDIQRHYETLALRDADVALQAVQAIRKAGDSLETFPRRGAILHEAIGLRKLQVTFGKAGFSIHYAVIEEEVVILRVYHGRENRPN